MENTLINTKSVDFSKSRQSEPEWLYTMRRQSWEMFLDQPLPDRAEHLWRYTDPRQFIPEKLDHATGTTRPSSHRKNKAAKSLSENLAAPGYPLQENNNGLISSDEIMGNKAIIKNLAHAAHENEDIVIPHLGRLVGPEFGKFEGLNLALWENGLFIYVPDNVTIAKPIHLQRSPITKFTALRLLVVAGKNAAVTLVDDYAGNPDMPDALVNSVIEIYAGDHSRVRYVGWQRQTGQAKSFITQRSHLGADSQMHIVLGSMDGAVSKMNTGSILDGRGADSRIFGLLFGSDTRHHDLHTRHHHKHGETYSNIDFKVILKDTATSAYTGLIRIDEKAVNCEAFQENRNLLLNRGARAESIPELEILCDQVRCSHGATMGPIDPEILFYLKNRGIDHNQAVKTVISGFAEPVMAQFPQYLSDALQKSMALKLETD